MKIFTKYSTNPSLDRYDFVFRRSNPSFDALISDYLPFELSASKAQWVSEKERK